MNAETLRTGLPLLLTALGLVLATGSQWLILLLLLAEFALGLGCYFADWYGPDVQLSR
jgi:hypothetical protein